MNTAAPRVELEWTGERLVTSCHRPLVFEHVHRYAIACAIAEGKRVLDIACGEGYGANLLAQTAAHVTGVDIDERTIAHAAAKYPHRNLTFVAGACSEIPCADQSIDLVASFETIEHIEDQKAFLAEIKRVLAPGGVLIMSSPNKAEYRAASGSANRFHQVELTHEEFVRLMRDNFHHCIAGRQRLVTGSWIAPDQPGANVATGTFVGNFNRVTVQPGVARGIYSIAICSDDALPPLTLGLFEDLALSAETWHLLDRDETPAAIERDLQEKTRRFSELEEAVNEKKEQVVATREAFEEKARHVIILQAEVAQKTQQVFEARAAFEEKLRHLSLLERDLAEKQQQIVTTTAAFEEKERHVALLQDEVVQLKEERLSHERVRLENDQLAQMWDELAEARWELLTLRGNLIGGEYSNGVTAGTLAAQNRADSAETERDCMRGMVHQLQGELDKCRSKLDGTTKKLTQLQGRVKKLLAHPVQKLILPFSSPQRKLRRLTRSQTGG